MEKAPTDPISPSRDSTDPQDDYSYSEEYLDLEGKPDSLTESEQAQDTETKEVISQYVLPEIPDEALTALKRLLRVEDDWGRPGWMEQWLRVRDFIPPEVKKLVEYSIADNLKMTRLSNMTVSRRNAELSERVIDQAAELEFMDDHSVKVQAPLEHQLAETTRARVKLLKSRKISLTWHDSLPACLAL
jgi:hypothetical protein